MVVRYYISVFVYDKAGPQALQLVLLFRDISEELVEKVLEGIALPAEEVPEGTARYLDSCFCADVDYGRLHLFCKVCKRLRKAHKLRAAFHPLAA